MFDGYYPSHVSSWFFSKADIEDASPSERRCLRTPRHLRSRCWRHLYRSYLMSMVIFCRQVSLASLIRTRCLGVFPRRKSVTKRVAVKYIHFEREPTSPRSFESGLGKSERPGLALDGQKESDTGPKDPVYPGYDVPPLSLHSPLLSPCHIHLLALILSFS